MRLLACMASSAPVTALSESRRKHLVRGVGYRPWEQIEAVALHLRKQVVSEPESDPETSTAGIRYPDRLTALMIGEEAGAVGQDARLVERRYRSPLVPRLEMGS